MSSQLITPQTEAAIWARLMDSQREDLMPDAARYLLSFQFPESDRVRMQELAEKSEAGSLTEDDGRELDSYLHVGNLLAVMQSKARMILYGQQTSQPHS